GEELEGIMRRGRRRHRRLHLQDSRLLGERRAGKRQRGRECRDQSRSRERIDLHWVFTSVERVQASSSSRTRNKPTAVRCLQPERPRFRCTSISWRKSKALVRRREPTP